MLQVDGANADGTARVTWLSAIGRPGPCRLNISVNQIGSWKQGPKEKFGPAGRCQSGRCGPAGFQFCIIASVARKIRTGLPRKFRPVNFSLMERWANTSLNKRVRAYDTLPIAKAPEAAHIAGNGGNGPKYEAWTNFEYLTYVLWLN